MIKKNFICVAQKAALNGYLLQKQDGWKQREECLGVDVVLLMVFGHVCIFKAHYDYFWIIFKSILSCCSITIIAFLAKIKKSVSFSGTYFLPSGRSSLEIHLKFEDRTVGLE